MNRLACVLVGALVWSANRWVSVMSYRAGYEQGLLDGGS